MVVSAKGNSVLIIKQMLQGSYMYYKILYCDAAEFYVVTFCLTHFPPSLFETTCYRGKSLQDCIFAKYNMV